MVTTSPFTPLNFDETGDGLACLYQNPRFFLPTQEMIPLEGARTDCKNHLSQDQGQPIFTDPSFFENHLPLPPPRNPPLLSGVNYFSTAVTPLNSSIIRKQKRCETPYV